MRSIITVIGCVGCLAGVAVAAPPSPMRLVSTIALEGVEGRIDHMALDAAGQRLVVVALGNHTVEVLDLRAGRRVRSLTGFRSPQGVGFVASPPRFFVADGGDGSVSMLDAGSFQPLRRIRLADDADNVRVDTVGRRVVVGFGSGGLAVLDAATGERLGSVELPAHPESFQLDSGAERIFVNVPEAGEIAVVDGARSRVAAHWRLGDARANFPMALDAGGRRLLIGCRRPAEVLVLDAESGRRLARVPIDGDADDLFFDATTQRLYASCGAGFVDVLDAPPSGALRTLARIPTATGARTSLFDETRRRLFVAVPRRGARAAEIRIFEVAR